MPLSIASIVPQSQNPSAAAAAYPATTKQIASVVNGVPTNVTTVIFADKIMVTISQNGRLAQWIHVPLHHSANANFADQHIAARSSDGEDSLLPSTHLTPTTLLGGSTSERETIGQLYATQIASAIVMKDPQEQRTVMVGLGLSKFEANRDIFYDIIDMVMACL